MPKMCVKKKTLGESTVKWQEMRLAELKRKEVLLFTKGPGGNTSNQTQEYLNVKQEEFLKPNEEFEKSE